MTNRFISNEIKPLAVLESAISEKRFLETNENIRMREVSKNTEIGVRTALYRKYYKDDGLIAGSFLLGLVCPGAGSLLLGDTDNAFSVMIPGVIAECAVLVSGVAVLINGNNQNRFSDILVAGGAVFVVCGVIGEFNVLDYSRRWNSGLKSGLDLASRRDQTHNFLNGFAFSMHIPVFSF